MRVMKVTFLFLFLFASLSFPCMQAEGGSTELVIDQMQSVADVTVGGLAIGGTSQQRLAETVTVGVSGRLRGVFFPIDCESGTLLIEVRNVEAGKPGDVVLGRGKFSAAKMTPTGTAFRFFKLGGKSLTFTAMDHFAIVLENNTGSCGIFQGPLGNPYSGGEAFFEALPNPPGWVPFSDFDTRTNLPFLTEVSLP